MSDNDLTTLFSAQEKVKRWNAEHENTSARLELARIDKNIAFLISQHNPIARLGVDREVLRLIFKFVKHGEEGRLVREFEILKLGKEEGK